MESATAQRFCGKVPHYPSAQRTLATHLDPTSPPLSTLLLSFPSRLRPGPASRTSSHTQVARHEYPRRSTRATGRDTPDNKWPGAIQPRGCRPPRGIPPATMRAALLRRQREQGPAEAVRIHHIDVVLLLLSKWCILMIKLQKSRFLLPDLPLRE